MMEINKEILVFLIWGFWFVRFYFKLVMRFLLRFVFFEKLR